MRQTCDPVWQQVSLVAFWLCLPSRCDHVRRQGLLGVGAVGVGCLAYAGLYEVNAFRLRRVEVPVLPPGARPIRVLHISDLHLTPHARARQRWLSPLAALEPDLVVDTGDNLAHPEAVPFVLGSSRPAAGRAGRLRLGIQRLLRPDVQEPAALSSGPSSSDRRSPAGHAALAGSRAQASARPAGST